MSNEKFKHPSSFIPFSFKEYVNETVGNGADYHRDFIHQIIIDESRFIPKYLISSINTFNRKGNTLFKEKGNFQLKGRDEQINNLKEAQFLLDVENENLKEFEVNKSDLLDKGIEIGLYDKPEKNGSNLLQKITIDPYYLENLIRNNNRIFFPVEVIDLMKRLEYKFLDSTLNILHFRLINYRHFQHLKFKDEKSRIVVAPKSEYGNSSSEFSGSYASDVAGYSDDAINDAFEGDPDNYWNID
jgi:hypothetical protein